MATSGKRPATEARKESLKRAKERYLGKMHTTTFMISKELVPSLERVVKGSGARSVSNLLTLLAQN